MGDRFILGLNPEESEIEIGPENEFKEVLQNVAMIWSTPKGTVPLNRDFGLDWSVVDQPLPKARALLISDGITQTRKYEPRARIVKVEWPQTVEQSAEGALYPILTVEITLTDS